MVTAWIIKQKFLDKQKKREDAIRAKAEAQIAEQRAEILAEANRKLEEWNRRRLTAQYLAVPFHEPPPDLTKP